MIPMSPPPPPFVRCVTTGGIDPSCNDTHATVQGAINAANNGDTILIAPGTYTEQVTITKNLTITTTATGVIIKAPNPMVADAHGQFNIVTIGGGVTVSISNLVILCPGPGPCGSINAGVFVGGNSHLSMTGVLIPEIHNNPFSGCQNGIGIQIGKQAFAEVGHAVITNTAVSNYQKAGIVVDNVGSDATITGDTIDGHGDSTVIAQNGIQISRGATAIVENNLVQGNQCDVPGVCGSDPINDTQLASSCCLTQVTQLYCRTTLSKITTLVFTTLPVASRRLQVIPFRITVTKESLRIREPVTLTITRLTAEPFPCM